MAVHAGALSSRSCPCLHLQAVQRHFISLVYCWIGCPGSVSIVQSQYGSLLRSQRVIHVLHLHCLAHYRS